MCMSVILVIESITWLLFGISLPFRGFHPILNYVIIVVWVLVGFFRTQYSLNRYHLYSTGRDVRMRGVILGIVMFVLIKIVAFRADQL